MMPVFITNTYETMCVCSIYSISLHPRRISAIIVLLSSHLLNNFHYFCLNSFTYRILSKMYVFFFDAIFVFYKTNAGGLVYTPVCLMHYYMKWFAAKSRGLWASLVFRVSLRLYRLNQEKPYINLESFI